MIELRRLTNEDYEDILDISKGIWGGTDYLPRIFHKWVEDKGIFLGAVDKEKNKVIAVAKLSVLYDGSGWLEGLRVHKDYRGQKIGKKISSELLDMAKKELEEGKINKIAFATHISNEESKTMMEKMNFKIKEAQMFMLKKMNKLEAGISLESFNVEPWDISFEEFESHPYFVKRKGQLSLAFVFEEVTEKLFEDLKEHNCFVKVNGHGGLYKYKGEPYFVAMEDNAEAINAFMDHYLLKFKDKGIKEILTPVLPEDRDLISGLEKLGYEQWGDGKPDYLYYVYEV